MNDPARPRGWAAALSGWDRRFALTLAAAAVLAAIGLAAPESRGLQVLSLAAALGALAVVGARVAGALLPEEEPAERVLPALTSAFGAAILLSTALGHCGVLGHRGWFLGLAAALLASLLLPRPRTSSPPPPGLVRSAGVELLERALLALAIGAVVASLASRMLEQRFEPVGLGFDDASYHLTAVATWNRFGDLRMWKFPVGDGGTTFYPIGSELWTWTLLAPLRDSDLLARWAQLPFALASLLALLALGRRLGVPIASSALAAVLVAANPEAFSVLALGAGNDYSTAFFALAAIDGALVVWRRRRPGSFAYAGIALGLLAGTKYLGFLHAAALGVMLAAGCLGRGELTAPRLRRLAGGLLTTVAVLFAVGGYCYLRNLVSVGNPWFPLPVLGLPGWPGVSVAERAAAPEFQIEPWRFLTRRPDLFGPSFAFTLLPAALIAPLLAAARRRWREVLIFLVPAALFLQFLFLTHDHRHLRYFLAGVAVAALAWVWILERLPRWWRWSARVATLLAVLWCVLAQVPLAEPDGRRGAVVGLIAALAAGWLSMAGPRWPSRRAAPRWAAAATALLLLATPALANYVAAYQQRKLDHSPAPARLEALTLGKSADVAYVGHNRPYLFYGRRLQNRVEAVPRTGPPASRYYQWGDHGAWPFGRGRFQRWQRHLRALGIDYVVVVRAGEAMPERRWMRTRPAEFELVFQWREFEIYRLNTAERAAPASGAARLWREQLRQDPQDLLTGLRADRPHLRRQTLPIHGPDLVQHDLAAPPAEGAVDPGGIGPLAGGHRGHDYCA